MDVARELVHFKGSKSYNKLESGLNSSSCDSVFAKCCLPITKVSSAHRNYGRIVTGMRAKKAIRNSSDTLGGDLVNFRCHVRHRYFTPMHKDLG